MGGGNNSSTTTTTTTTSTTNNNNNDLRVVIALLDLNEPYSIQLLETLVAICHDHHPTHPTNPVTTTTTTTTTTSTSDCPFQLIIATQNHGIHYKDDDTDDTLLSWEDEMLMGSGSCKLLSDTNHASSASSMEYRWYQLMGFTSCPAVAVVDGRTGRRCTDAAHEELAIVWNQEDIHGIRQRWIQKQSAFTSPYQKLQAQILFPTACQIM
jgi:hypothetical protein